ncbi:rplA family protein [Pseudomonas gingeri NCPPB 3146 = LMG 5327]|uniref:RplA family protein n=1 Tax=Pseudomonas gingeri NCPPB 3146 = LMG 5327 TaxID=707248 RepID=A0ABX4XZ09_9PSED|nr:rplA family protein [Pseudomonas gingeri NCPPB 3146 = LMG 5327]
MSLWTLCVRCCDAERHGLHSHAERGNDQSPASRLPQ